MKNQKNVSPLLVPSLSCAPRPHGRSGRGFSLVEMLVVLLILGIIFTVGGGEIARA
ncbi:MAG TPA: type II secretion system protein, partial [Thermoanaerobaculia bacterium]